MKLWVNLLKRNSTQLIEIKENKFTSKPTTINLAYTLQINSVDKKATGMNLLLDAKNYVASNKLTTV